MSEVEPARPRPRFEAERIAVRINEACRLTGLGRTSIYALIASGRLESRSVGRRRLILVSSLRELFR